tara:strand:+ start:114 stop:1889 length:1776 start_codon:yes stop_codon:yes gene_type:complete
MSLYESDVTLLTSILINTTDIQYYPLIVSLSELNFNPTFLEYYNDTKIIPVPLASLAVHSIFYKLFNIYSFIILEYIFHSLLIFILFNIIKKIFNSSSIAGIFCVLIYILIFTLKALISFVEPEIFYKLYDILNENFGTRTPRPLVTGVFYFGFIYYMMFFEEKINNKLNYNYVLKIAIFFGLLANSFIFLFIHSFIFLLIFLIKISGTKLIEWIRFNYKKIFYFIFLLFFFFLPIVFQSLYGEGDSSSRAGLITISFEDKFFLIKYYLISLLRYEFIILFGLTLFFNWYFNKKKLLEQYIDKINIFFLLIMSSILSPFIFFIISPKIISIFHFVNIILFSFIFYIILSLFCILYLLSKNFNFKNYYSKKIFYIILPIICLSTFVPLELNSLLKSKDQRIEITKLHRFFDKNNLKNTNSKLFTNDLLIMNLWLLNNNTQLVISDAFSNSLSDKKIEFNLLNSLKDFDIGEKQLKELVSLDKSQVRNKLFMMLFNYKYQANTLHTFAELEDYNKIDQDLIIKTSPFRVQMQILPETEKKRIFHFYKDLEINLDLLPNYAVINNSNSSENFDIKNNKYKEIFKTKNYLVYKRL